VSEPSARSQDPSIDPLGPGAVLPHLRTLSLGRRLFFFRVVDSTNDLFRSGGLSSARSGTVVVAEEQRKGRGRQGRAWDAPPFRALLFSALLEVEGGAERAALANLVAALAAADAIESIGGPELRIRWPNDLVAEERKVAGILSEYGVSPGRLVIGIGLNVNQEGAELPEGAASLRTLAGRSFDRGRILAEILNRLEDHLAALDARGFEPLRRRIEERSSLVGRTALLDLGRETVAAPVAGVGPRGGLVLEIDGRRAEFLDGEVVRVLSPAR